MNEVKKGLKNRLKRSLARGKNIRKEMTRLGKIYTIFMVIMIILLTIFLFSAMKFGFFNIEFIIIFIFLIIPLTLIGEKINKNALKKYNVKIREQRMNFCMYCGGKLDSIQKFCPHCGEIFDDSISITPRTIEFEKNLQQEYDTERSAILEQKEIKNISKYFIWKSSIISYFLVALGLSIFLGILLNDLSSFIFFCIGMSIGGIFIVLIMGFIMNSMFIRSSLLITSQEIKLYIEKKLFLQINWSDIEKIDIYRERFHGYYIKINHNKNYDIICLEYCTFFKKNQKEIIETLFQFSNNLRDKTSIMNVSEPIVDEVGKKDLYEQIFNFASTQRFLFHKYGRQ